MESPGPTGARRHRARAWGGSEKIDSTNADQKSKHQGGSRSNQYRWHGIRGRAGRGGGGSMPRVNGEDVV